MIIMCQEELGKVLGELQTVRIQLYIPRSISTFYTERSLYELYMNLFAWSTKDVFILCLFLKKIAIPCSEWMNNVYFFNNDKNINTNSRVFINHFRHKKALGTTTTSIPTA